MAFPSGLGALALHTVGLGVPDTHGAAFFMPAGPVPLPVRKMKALSGELAGTDAQEGRFLFEHQEGIVQPCLPRALPLGSALPI